MAVFIGEAKNTSATRAALKINYARTYIINPAVAARYFRERVQKGRKKFNPTDKKMRDKR